MSDKFADNGNVKAQLAGALKELTGLSPTELQESLAELKAQKEAGRKVERQYMADVGSDSMSKAGKARYNTVVKYDKFGGLGLGYARFVRSAAWALHARTSPEAVAKAWGDSELADLHAEARHKALSAGTGSSGGHLIPEGFQAEVIELLRAMAVVRGAGARVVPMPNGQMSMPKLTAAATSAYVGENSNATSSQQTFASINLVAKKLVTLTPVSNDLLRYASPEADMLIRDDLVQSMALKEDISFIRSLGTASEPKGIRYQVHANNVFARAKAGSSSTAAEMASDLFKAVRLVKGANVRLVNPGWIMTTRSKVVLESQRDSAGWLFRDELSQGKLLGYPVHEENQIPETLGGGTETEVYFGEFTHALIGDSRMMEVQVYDGGAYHDGSNVISGLSQDQTVIRAISAHDFALRHDKAFSVISTVDWVA